MRLFLISLLWATTVFAEVKSESFVILIKDRSIAVLSPETKRNLFAVILDNRSLSDQVGKFIVNGKILKYVSVKSGKTETIEIENKAAVPVTFVPVSPAFQEVDLQFGKKAYEIPSKE